MRSKQVTTSNMHFQDADQLLNITRR